MKILSMTRLIIKSGEGTETQLSFQIAAYIRLHIDFLMQLGFLQHSKQLLQ